MSLFCEGKFSTESKLWLPPTGLIETYTNDCGGGGDLKEIYMKSLQVVTHWTIKRYTGI